MLFGWGRSSGAYGGHQHDRITTWHKSPIVSVACAGPYNRIPAGVNSNGELGDGSTTARGTPAQVATDLLFVDIAAGNQHTCGLLANGSYACWGEGPQTGVWLCSHSTRSLLSAKNMLWAPCAGRQGMMRAGNPRWCNQYMSCLCMHDAAQSRFVARFHLLLQGPTALGSWATAPPQAG